MARPSVELHRLESTREPLVIPVDFSSSFDPPTGVCLATQHDVDNVLARGGASAFKHLQSVWEVLPTIVRHDVTLNLASGVHRPLSPVGNRLAGWQLSGKILQPANSAAITVQGVLGSQYNVYLGSLTLTGTSGGDDPYVDFSGTPFSGWDLRGRFLVLDTGQVTVIHKHTNSRLYVTDVPSPTPSGGFVGWPGTTLRNSLDDVNPLPGSYYGLMVDFASPMGMGGAVQLSDISLSGFGCDELMVSAGYVYGQRLLFDHAGDLDAFGATAARAMVDVFDRSASAYLSRCSMRGDGIAGTPGTSSRYNAYQAYGYVGFSNSYVAGTFYGLHAAGESAVLGFSHSVLDQINQNAIEILERSKIGLGEYGTGKTNTIRNCGGGLSFWGDSLVDEGDQLMQFEGMTGACIQLNGYASKIGTEYDYQVKFVNGAAGGNLDVGVSYGGQKGWARLRPETTVSGALGDIRFAGTIYSHAQVQTLGPLTDPEGNYCRHD